MNDDALKSNVTFMQPEEVSASIKAKSARIDALIEEIRTMQEYYNKEVLTKNDEIDILLEARELLFELIEPLQSISSHELNALKAGLFSKVVKAYEYKRKSS